jgi:hypothetical protein
MDNLEQGLGRYTYVDLPQVKDYLSISSNTQDARLSNIIHYATGVIEHYIGQEVLANTYTEVFDGGVSSIFVSRLPLSAVYQVTEFNGSSHSVLADPREDGSPISSVAGTALRAVGNVELSPKVKRFGISSAKLANSSYIYSDSLSSDLTIEEGSFTIELFLRNDATALQNTSIVTIAEDSQNYLQFSLANAYGLSFTTKVNNVVTTVLGANASIEAQQYRKRQWSHLAVTRDADNERLYLHFNGNTIANVSVDVLDLSFSNTLTIGGTFAGYIDEVRVSSNARYVSDFIIPSNRFRPDSETNLLIHFDDSSRTGVIVDAHATQQEYNFSQATGEITKDTGIRHSSRTYRSMQKSYPALTLTGPAAFSPYPNGVNVQYRAGYETGRVPYDLQIATLDYIKTIYKQDQEKRSFNFEGERGESFDLSGNFPPHVRRVLDLYRIIK